MTKLIDNLTQESWYLVLGALVLLLLWHFGSRKLSDRPLTRRFPRLTAALDLLALPFLFVFGGSLVRALNRMGGYSELDAILRAVTMLLAYLAAGWALSRLINVCMALRLDKPPPELIRGLIRGVLLFAGFALFMWQEGYSLSGVWVSTGVAAAVVGLALQATLGDLFSGIALSMEGPLQLGDWVELDDGTTGEVVDQTWRAIYLRDWDNTTHVIPNSRVAGQKLKNLHAEDHLYAPWFYVKVPSEADPSLVTALLLDAAMRCEDVLESPNPVVRLVDASSVPYSYMVWVHVKNYPAMFRAREELFREIHHGLQEAGIEVAPQVQEFRTRRARVSTGEPPTILLALKSLDFARVMTEEELKLVAARSEYRHHDDGQVLLAEGASSDAFYVIAGGLVDASVRLPDGSRRIVETLGAGKHFGITATLTPDPSFLDYVAKTHVTLIRIDIECVGEVVGKRPEIAERLAGVIKHRVDATEAVRMQSRLPARRLRLRDIREFLVSLGKR